MIFKHPFDGFGLHLTAPAIDDPGPLTFRPIKDVFGDKTPFQKEPGFFSTLMPADKPVDGFTRIFIQKQVQVKIKPFLIGEQITDITTPALIRSGDLFSNQWEGTAIRRSLNSPHRDKLGRV